MLLPDSGHVFLGMQCKSVLAICDVGVVGLFDNFVDIAKAAEYVIQFLYCHAICFNSDGVPHLTLVLGTGSRVAIRFIYHTILLVQHVVQHTLFRPFVSMFLFRKTLLLWLGQNVQIRVVDSQTIRSRESNLMKLRRKYSNSAIVSVDVDTIESGDGCLCFLNVVHLDETLSGILLIEYEYLLYGATLTEDSLQHICRYLKT